MADGYQGYAGYGSPQSPQDARMRLAASMMQNGVSTAPIRSPWQGAAQLAQALGGRMMMGQIQQGQTDAANTTLANSPFAGATGGPAPNLSGSGGVATGGANTPTPPAGGSPNGGSPFPLPPRDGASSLPAQIGAAGPQAGNSYSNDQGGHAAFIRARAAALGIDPNFALSVASAEGLRALSANNPNGASSVDLNPDGTPFSFGDFQLNVRNGLGTEARKRGIDPADPRQWQAADEYALETMAKGGLQPWKGDAAVNAYQKQGGGWQAPPAGGGQALAYGGGPPITPAVAAINGATGGAGGFPTPPGPSGSFPTPPAPGGAQMAQNIDPQMAQRAQALLGVALNPNASPETRQQAAAMYQSLAAIAAPHPFTWETLPGTNNLIQKDWLGRPTGQTMQGGPMKMGADDQLYSPGANGSVTYPAGGNSPPPNNGAGDPPPNGGPGGPGAAPGGIPGAPAMGGAPAAPPTLAGAPAPRPGGLGMVPGSMTLPGSAGGPAGGPSPAPATNATPAPAAPTGGGPQAAGTASANGQIDPLANIKVSGEDYLSSPAVAQSAKWGPLASQARAILRGQQAFPTGAVGGKPVDQNLVKLLYAADPNFSAAMNTARMGAVQQFSDKTTPGAPGGMILAANTALHHLGALADTFKEQGNGDWSAVNWMKNEAGVWGKGGNAAHNDYEFNANGLVDELAKIYKGGTPAQAEIETMAKSLSPSMTRDEFAHIAAKMSTMLQGKTSELQRQWHDLYGTQASDFPVIGDEGKAQIQRFNGGSQQEQRPAGAPSNATQAPDGKWYAPDPSRPGKYVRFD